MTFSNLINGFAGGTGALSAISSGATVDGLDDIYQVTVTNWYKTLPYGFVFFDRLVNAADPSTAAERSTTFYLPISPENIQVKTHMATNVVTTLYGVVEEHTDVRYYDMTISGTTGIAPKYFTERLNSSLNTRPTLTSTGANFEGYMSQGRSAFSGPSSVESGPLTSLLAPVNNIISRVSDTINQLGDAIGVTNGDGRDTSGIAPDKSGYAAFHNFYRFLLKYKKDAAGLGRTGNVVRQSAHSLSFVNYKDGLRYDCVPLDFTLTRDARNPMLYNYNIKMRCYNMRNTTSSGQPSSQVEALGLVTSASLESNTVFNQVADIARGASILTSRFL